jgi:hypothetical protein
MKVMKNLVLASFLLIPLSIAAQVSNPSIVQTLTEPASCPILPFYYIASSNLLYGGNGSGTCQQVNSGGGGGSGTVTSVTFTGDGVVDSATPSSAVTTSGTVTATIKTQTANTVLAGPTTGSAAAPTFRALVSADIPNNAANTTGTSGGLSGSPAITVSSCTGCGGGSYQYSVLPQPVYANFTQVNFQSGTTVGTAGGNMFITMPYQSALNWQLLKQTANPGSTPWSVQAFIAAVPTGTASATSSGLYISDGTKLAGMEVLNGSTLRFEHMNSVTSDLATIASAVTPPLYSSANGQYYRICDSGTTIYYETSMDGASWFVLPSFSETVGSFITPTQVLVGGVSEAPGGNLIYINVKGWSVTASAVCP